MAVLESQKSAQVFAKLDDDILAPGQVTGLTHTVEQGKVVLNWTAVITNSDASPADDVTTYAIYRKDSVGDVFAKIGSVSSPTVTYEDLTAKDGATYVYAVSALDDAPTANEGAKSADHEVKTIPSVPTGLMSTATETAIKLSWTSVKEDLDTKLNENLAGYNIYRSEVDGSGYAKVNSVLAGVNAFDDTTAVPGTTYYYVITAFDDSL